MPLIFLHIPYQWHEIIPQPHSSLILPEKNAKQNNVERTDGNFFQDIEGILDKLPSTWYNTLGKRVHPTD